MRFRNLIARVFNYRIQDPALNNMTSGKTFEEKQADIGVFEYDQEGLTLRYEEIAYQKNWSDIDAMHMYKKDMITTDRVELQIITGDRTFTISEDLPGWYQFLARAQAALPTMMSDWENKVIQPPFALNWTTVYVKGQDQSNEAHRS